MNEQVYAQTINMIDTFAQKQHLKGLCEFEYKLYEHACNAMAVYFSGLKYAFQISAMKTEQECHAQEVEYLAFIAKVEEEKLAAERAEMAEENESEDPPEEQTEV
jgi:hypothetical protein